MALQGNIDSFSVVDVLRLLGSSGKSGRLVVDGDRGSGSLWMDAGLVVAATTSRVGASPVDATPADVLFDLLRFDEGAFVFEADVAGPVGGGGDARPVEVEAMIAEAEVALVEWDEITAVVPSLQSQVALAVELAGETVELDRRVWSGVVGVAAGIAVTGDRTTVGAVAELAGLSELPALRLIRDLATAGLVEIGPEVAADGADAPRYEAAFEHTPFVDPAPDAYASPFGSAYDSPFGSEPERPLGAHYEPAGVDPAAFGGTPPSYEPPVFDPAAPGAPDLPPPTGEPEVLSPIGNVGATAGFDLFEPFDPFGTSGSPVDPRPGIDADPEPTDAGGGPWSSDGVESPDPVAERAGLDPGADTTAMSAEEEAAQQAEFARQLAMLSPRAAEAVASAEAGPSTEDEERARVARFLGSV